MSPFTVVEHAIPASHLRDYPRATAVRQDDTLLLAVKQYVPRDNASPQHGDLSIIAAHANGFPKELYEPLWDDLYREARRRGVRIRAIYIADAAWQGRSGLLNRGKIGDDPGWNDYARDIVHLANHFRPPPPLLAIGHSFGANALANAALLHPRLFSAGLVLLDPVIGDYDASALFVGRAPAALSINRRDVWPSRADAADAFRRSPFYQAWDPRVLDRWIRFGLRPVAAAAAAAAADGPSDAAAAADDDAAAAVTLATSKHQEVFTFMRPSWPAFDGSGTHLIDPDRCPDLDAAAAPSANSYPFYRAESTNTMARLPSLRPPVLYLLGARSVTTPPDMVRRRTAVTGTGPGGSGGAARARVRQLAHPDAGHLVPFEEPAWCARQAADWAAAELARWRAADDEFRDWAARPLADKTTVSDEFRRRLGVARPRRDKARL